MVKGSESTHAVASVIILYLKIYAPFKIYSETIRSTVKYNGIGY